MYKWIIKNSLLTLANDDFFAYLAYDEAKKAINEGIFEFRKRVYKYSNKELNLRISKIGLLPKIFIDYYNEKIHIKMLVNRRGQQIDIPVVAGMFMDYICLDNALYFLAGDFSIVNTILGELGVQNVEDINYFQYLQFIKKCSIDNINIEDYAVNKIKNISFNEDTIEDNDLNADLFDYQSNGKRWLNFMVYNNCGCILADEMGLGKTLQIIALFGLIKKRNPNAIFLVIAPLSLLENWKREFIKFYPKLNILIQYGNNRTGLYFDLLDYDVIITSYTTVVSDISMFNMIEWDVVVLDEAQNIKNPHSQRAKIVKQINKKVGIAVTGTPFENHISDLWSILDFVIPGYLGNLNQFTRFYDDDIESAKKIEKLLSPIMIRRRVSDVAKDLPNRIDIPHPVIMTNSEAKYYENERLEVIKNDLNSVNIQTIQRLRMFCTHPIVYNKQLYSNDPYELSQKYQLLCDILDDIISYREKVVIFTSFNTMIEIILNDIRRRFNVYTDYINGEIEVIERQKKIDSFTAIDGAAVLILNPKAAGTGLNITAANHVIHYNLEWNPALEDQASARVYRRGQDKTVFVHRLFYIQTIEEIINDRIERKRDLAANAVIGNDGTKMNKNDLINALNISPFEGE